MLMISPRTLAALRSETRAVPVTLPKLRCLEPRQAPPPKARRLPRNRREALAELVGTIMREIEPTPFAAEGPCRAGIRARLCEDGWRWSEADAQADEIVQSALSRVGAKRPSWEEGQREHAQKEYADRGRETCKRCGRPLPDNRRIYCGPVCEKSARLDRDRQADLEADSVRKKLYLAAWSERQPERSCVVCGKAFRPRNPRSKTCSRACALEAAKLAADRARSRHP